MASIACAVRNVHCGIYSMGCEECTLVSIACAVRNVHCGIYSMGCEECTLWYL